MVAMGSIDAHGPIRAYAFAASIIIKMFGSMNRVKFGPAVCAGYPHEQAVSRSSILDA